MEHVLKDINNVSNKEIGKEVNVIKIRKEYVIGFVAICLFGLTYLWNGFYLKVDETIQQSKNEWTITQYSSQTNNQSMFYIIEDKWGSMTVVDGGYKEDADYVKNTILEKGNVVDNWIITHPHPDHVGAFNYIIKNYGDEITINHIYAIELDYDSYKANAREWDGFEEYEKFLSVTKDASNLIYVHDGDDYELDGLHMRVLNAYSKKIDALSNDLANDGSMMFKIWGNYESMLFCADVGYKISDKIIDEFKEELPSDYIQMGHHGNGGLTEEFYKLVNPKVAFFDAPEWLMKNLDPDTGKRGKWHTLEKISLMEKLGTKIYGFPTAPNGIILK